MKMAVTHKKGIANFNVEVCPRNVDDYGVGNYVVIYNDNTDYYLDGRYWGVMDTEEQVKKFVSEWAKDNWGENFVKVEIE